MQGNLANSDVVVDKNPVGKSPQGFLGRMSSPWSDPDGIYWII
jgi:hypothetical protein